MKKVLYAALTALCVISLTTACAPVISKELREQVSKDLSFKEVLQDPEAYKGTLVLWGGKIIRSENQKQGTLLEVLQKPTDREGRPKDVDQSEGRFLALHEGFLDVAIYSEGREVTLAGEIKGKRVLPLGEIQYTYPVILTKEIYLWPAESKERLYPHPYPYTYPYWPYPWWRYGPYHYRYW